MPPRVEWRQLVTKKSIKEEKQCLSTVRRTLERDENEQSLLWNEGSPSGSVAFE